MICSRLLSLALAALFGLTTVISVSPWSPRQSSSQSISRVSDAYWE
jgi:hypothetical protein